MTEARRQWPLIAGLVGLGCVVLVAIFGDLLVSNTPVLMKIDGRTRVFPGLSDTELARKGRSEIQRQIAERGGWAVWPLLVTERSPTGAVDVVAAGDARDVLALWVRAARGTLSVAALVAIIAFVLGSVFGACAAVGPRFADALLARSVELSGTLPAVIVIALVQALPGVPSLTAFIASMAALRALETARVVRGRAVQLMTEDFVTAARALGISDRQLFQRHLLPHVVGPALVSTLVTTAVVIAVDAALSFLGLRTGNRCPSWGDVLGVAPQKGYFWLSATSSAGIVVTVGACFLLVEALSREARFRGTHR